jgi:hypothetical protein
MIVIALNVQIGDEIKSGGVLVHSPENGVLRQQGQN